MLYNVFVYATLRQIKNNKMRNKDKLDFINQIVEEAEKQCDIHVVIVPKGTLCDVCGSENTITVSHKGKNCDWCNPL